MESESIFIDENYKKKINTDQAKVCKWGLLRNLIEVYHNQEYTKVQEYAKVQCDMAVF